jgi:hypothetical protein
LACCIDLPVRYCWPRLFTLSDPDAVSIEANFACWQPLANRSLIAFAAGLCPHCGISWHSGMQKNAGIEGHRLSKGMARQSYYESRISAIPDALSATRVKQIQSPLPIYSVLR